MTARTLAGRRYFLNAVFNRRSPQLKTLVLNQPNFDAVLNEHPAAITLAPQGVVNADSLLGEWVDEPDFLRLNNPASGHRWRCYAVSQSGQFEFKESVDAHSLQSGGVEFLQRWAQISTPMPTCALVPDVGWNSEQETRLRVLLRRVLVQSSSGGAAPAYAPFVPVTTSKSDDDEEASDREKLVRIRREMLDRVGAYTSEELATAAQSITTNASQYAADQRNAEKIFGVRFGQAWHYPKFQFDPQRRVLPEMKDVLAALSPDEQGWDRLQWFLEPHEKLKGHTPLEVWKTDRGKVIEAANMERWNERL